MARYLHEIAGDETVTNASKAKECLRAMGELEGGQVEDLALPGLRVAAQTFAMLAVADALTSYRGDGIADVLLP